MGLRVRAAQTGTRNGIWAGHGPLDICSSVRADTSPISTPHICPSDMLCARRSQGSMSGATGWSSFSLPRSTCRRMDLGSSVWAENDSETTKWYQLVNFELIAKIDN